MRLFILITVSIICCNVNAQEAVTKADLNWLVGNWEMKTSKLVISESWIAGKDSSYIGKGYVTKGNDTIVREQMRIDKVGDFWVFIAQVNANSPVLFTLKPSSNTQELEFENLEHDNPQRVIYELVSKNKIHARTEADVNGKEEVDEYMYLRIND